MAYRSTFPRNIFAELDRFQRDMQQALGIAPAIRGSAWGGFPAMNMGHTPEAVLVYLFLPGMAPESIVAEVDKGVLTIHGERSVERPAEAPHQTLHIDERFSGHFRRAIILPDDVDDDNIQANYRDGILYIRLQRRETARSRRLDIQ
ncbi:Hsp20 family protein [Pusillimonas sp. TS35]|jgi:HSP20 family protein|uniref:Hsp20/alpha crystallin family protein n=1 Tax=Paracandidimonas lactea TaxID=2895524 RepID=UPI00136CC684|nr:Hsp20/alpha crystallin family protein [Paracandidimonas lactea]MYN12574.1 Hsp20 family protein [Pusillimonas sp. TS35]